MKVYTRYNKRRREKWYFSSEISSWILDYFHVRGNVSRKFILSFLFFFTIVSTHSANERRWNKISPRIDYTRYTHNSSIYPFKLEELSSRIFYCHKTQNLTFFFFFFCYAKYSANVVEIKFPRESWLIIHVRKSIRNSSIYSFKLLSFFSRSKHIPLKIKFLLESSLIIHVRRSVYKLVHLFFQTSFFTIVSKTSLK